MTDEKQKSYWVTFLRRDGHFTGHVVSFEPPGLLPEVPPPRKPKEISSKEDERVGETANLNFEGVIDLFVRDMESYMDFLAFTIELAPRISNTIAEIELKEFVDRVALSESHNTENQITYELSTATFPELNLRLEKVLAAFHGATRLPELGIIGLISHYDAFLGNILRTIFTKKPEIVLTADKTISYAELSTANTIDSIRDSLIEREIENILRESHHEQFYLLEKKLNVKLREGLTVWPDFVELCQRRNLLTHTGGRISQQYIGNCKTHGGFIVKHKVGDRLRVDREYFESANKIIFEIGIKIAYVFWRKFFTSEADKADSKINQICYDLIFKRRYSIAESILIFSCNILKKYKGQERTRRMAIVNLANSMRLQGKIAEAKEVVSAEDWSASENAFKMGVAVIEENLDRVVALMRLCGKSDYPSAEHYRTWPIFRKIRDEDSFTTTFEEIFGEPLRKTMNISGDSDVNDA